MCGHACICEGQKWHSKQIYSLGRNIPFNYGPVNRLDVTIKHFVCYPIVPSNENMLPKRYFHIHLLCYYLSKDNIVVWESTLFNSQRLTERGKWKVVSPQQLTSPQMYEMHVWETYWLGGGFLGCATFPVAFRCESYMVDRGLTSMFSSYTWYEFKHLWKH